MDVRREKSNVVTEQQLAQMLDAARQEGFTQGQQAGTQSAEAEAQRAFQTAAEGIANQSMKLLKTIDQTRLDALSQATLIGQTIGNKLAGHLVMRFPQAELEALIIDSLNSVEDAPHLVIRCHPDLAESIKTIAEELIAPSGFSGRLLVMGEPEIAIGDGRLEWADGGVVRDSAAISEKIDAIVSAWLDAQTGPTVRGDQE